MHISWTFDEHLMFCFWTVYEQFLNSWYLWFGTSPWPFQSQRLFMVLSTRRVHSKDGSSSGGVGGAKTCSSNLGDFDYLFNLFIDFIKSTKAGVLICLDKWWPSHFNIRSSGIFSMAMSSNHAGHGQPFGASESHVAPYSARFPISPGSQACWDAKETLDLNPPNIYM